MTLRTILLCTTLLSAEAAAQSPFEGRKLRYLIGTDAAFTMQNGNVYEVGYDSKKPSGNGLAIAYANLFDERNTGKLGPYLYTSDTAAQYGEGQIDPKGRGWRKNLHEQFERRRAQGFDFIELDNPDAYSIAPNLGAFDLARQYGFKVVAKNPMLVDQSSRYASHKLVSGFIIEKGAGTFKENIELRAAINRPDIPLWFVAFGQGLSWAKSCASYMRQNRVKNAFCSYSSVGEYRSSRDIP